MSRIRLNSSSPSHPLHIREISSPPVQMHQLKESRGDSQTDEFLAMLGLSHCWTVPSTASSSSTTSSSTVSSCTTTTASVPVADASSSGGSSDPNEICIDEDEDDGNVAAAEVQDDPNEICVDLSDSDDEQILYSPTGHRTSSSTATATVDRGRSSSSIHSKYDVIEFE